MSTSSGTKPADTAAAELEKKLSEIGAKGRALSAQSLAQELSLPFAELKDLVVDPEALAGLPESDSRASGVALIQSSGGPAVAITVDPRTPAAKQTLETLGSRFPALVTLIVSQETFDQVLERYATIKSATAFEVGSIRVDDAAMAQAQERIQSIEDLKGSVSSVSDTQLLEILVAGALSLSASDIHFEPEVDGTRLRYRLDGLLHDVLVLASPRYHRVLNRIKVLSKLKLNITAAPQDGRFTIRQSDVEIEVRVSVLPSEYGESIVMRLLDPRSVRASIEDLGMRPDVLERVRELIKKPQGTFLTTGPTGSGKTTTLYAFVNELNTPDTKIITVEDPIEYHIKGINQTQVEPEKGYTFAGGLRAIVRQDPDIILIGEIRDLETADIAMEAALTGHLVLSTIHTNDAAGTIPRLLALGVKPETIAPALTMAMGQRLVRRLCQACKKEGRLSAEDQKRIGAEISPIAERFGLKAIGPDTSVWEPVGCQECNGIGYKGRVGVYEVFEVTREMERLILTAPSVTDIRDMAIQEGMVTMLQDGYLKMLEGATSLEEVRRVLG
ncbi:MAG: type II/IV secretion system protein [Candidatus Yanofskybacteria bacterium]|nr:type II/IV secretion system protein [Candidatus Yanofskybacteria bacterium]